MELFLLVACLSLFGLAVTAAAFGAATRSGERPTEDAEHETEAVPVIVRPQFFGDKVFLPEPLPPRVPVGALLLEIENHIRLEQAAAESFLEAPTPALLHSKTTSTLVH